MNINIGQRQATIGSTVSLKTKYETDTRIFNNGHLFKIRTIIDEQEVILEDFNGFIMKVNKRLIV